ncbi:hypothetical protein [Flavobacterium sp.]
MPKQKGIIKIEGTLDDITFFKRKDVYLARIKGGVSKERIMKDPAFKRTRENMSEFANTAKAGKTLRSACTVLIKSAFDGTLVQRLTKVFAAVKNMDIHSSRGLRSVSKGLATAGGKMALKGFDFNIKSALTSILFAPYALDTADGKITIEDLVPLDMLNYPPHASHVSFRSGFMNLDIENNISTIRYSTATTLPLDMTVSTVVLTPTAVPPGTGQDYYLLLVEFFQEVNGVLYALNNGNYNSLTLLEVK